MQYVKEILEELHRFNPEAYMEIPIEVLSLSPATSCRIVAEDSERITALEEKVEKLEGKLDDAEIGMVSEEDIQDAMADIMRALEKGDQDTAKKIIKDWM